MRAKLGPMTAKRLPPNPDKSPHRIHVAFPPFMRRNQSESGVLIGALASDASTRTNPSRILPLPYTMAICHMPEGTGTASVCSLEPEARACSTMIMVTPSNVFREPDTRSLLGVPTKAFSSGTYQCAIDSLVRDAYCIPTGRARRVRSFDVAVTHGSLSL